MIQGVIFSIVLIVFVIWLGIKSREKSKWGINLKRVSCPVCHTKQPVIRMPDSSAQAMWGGTTCPNCHTHLDKYGAIIS